MRFIGRSSQHVRRVQPISFMQRLDLYIGGAGRRAPAFESEEARRAAWEDHREQILNRFREKCPGMRPHAWWQYDAPEPRERDELAQLVRLGEVAGEELAAARAHRTPASKGRESPPPTAV